VPLQVVAGEEFTIQIDELGADPGDGSTPAGGTVSILGAVSPGGSYYIAAGELPRSFEVTAAGEPGELIQVVVNSGEAAGPGPDEGAYCEVEGSGLLRTISIVAPSTTTTSSTTSTTLGDT